MIDLSISIASYNTKDILRQCLSSIYLNTRGISFEIIVVDNASQDGSPDMIKRDFPFVILLENKENAGFGKAHNYAFGVSIGRYFLILNSDTYIHPKTLRRMIAFMDKQPEVGITGCKTYVDDESTFVMHRHPVPSITNFIILYTEFGILFPQSFLCKNYWNKSYELWETQESLEVDAVEGCAILIRRETFQHIGGFDENYFLFFEEEDLFREVKKKGWKIFYLPSARITHYVNKSHEGKDLSGTFMDSKRYYFKKHYGSVGWVLISIILFSCQNLLRLVKKIKLHKRRSVLGQITPTQDDPIPEFTFPKGKKDNKNYFEVSPSGTFSARAAVRVDGSSSCFTSDLERKLPANPVFWRLISVSKQNRIRSILATGKIYF
jgi:GT2 family glycosyltransferase